jgi:hypothetical protein
MERDLINGGKISVPPSGLGVAQQQPGDNNTFNHLVKTGSKLRLTAFPEKSIGPNGSIPAPRLALWVRGAGHCSHISSSWYHLENQLVQTNWP